MGIRLSWGLLVIVIIALFLGAMRDNTPLIEQAFFCAIYLGYVALTILALLAGRRWPGLLGFVVGGWAYFVPVFADLAGQRIQALPTTAGIKSFVTALAAPPPVPAGSRLVVTESNGTVYVRVDQPDGGTTESSTPMPIELNSPSQVIASNTTGPPISAADATMINNAIGQYLGTWQRGVTIGHLLMTLLCSCGGVILAIVFDRMLRRDLPRRDSE